MPENFEFLETNLDSISQASGRIAAILAPDGRLDQVTRRLNKLTKGAVLRATEDPEFKKHKPGAVITLAYPTGVDAIAIDLVVLDKRANRTAARRAGVALAKLRGEETLLVLAGSLRFGDSFFQGIALRSYNFLAHKSKNDEKSFGKVTFSHNKMENLKPLLETSMAITEAVFFTRDLVNEPANVLTTNAFAERLMDLVPLGLEVEVLDEAQLADLGMRALLGVGQGSASPSKVVVMQWNGGAPDQQPFALVGKGVVFDTGGISLKPGAGMQDMTMDMGGAAVVAGTMMALASRKAKANVVGLVGLVENMPSGTAIRPGDVITSMKGDTIEVLNTDAEGRLVLCDVMWYAQERFNPVAMVDLATLTGAIIVGLGHENAGVFSNDDVLCDALLNAAKSENEGAWRMPLGEAYNKLLKSRIADMANIGGRPAGSITAAQFLQRFVKDSTPWAHIDIAGVAHIKSDSDHAPAGATGWGVMTLNRLISDLFESP